MATGLGGGFSGICVVGTMVTLGGIEDGVSFGTLREGVGQYILSTIAGEGCSAFRAGAVGGLTVTLEKYERVFGWRRIDRRPALQTGFQWGVREPWRVRRRPRWRLLLSCRKGRGNCEGKTPQFWQCVLLGYVECRRGDIGSVWGGKVQVTIHRHRGGPRCGGCQVNPPLTKIGCWIYVLRLQWSPLVVI